MLDAAGQLAEGGALAFQVAVQGARGQVQHRGEFGQGRQAVTDLAQGHLHPVGELPDAGDLLHQRTAAFLGHLQRIGVGHRDREGPQVAGEAQPRARRAVAGKGAFHIAQFGIALHMQRLRYRQVEPAGRAAVSGEILHVAQRRGGDGLQVERQALMPHRQRRREMQFAVVGAAGMTQPEAGHHQPEIARDELQRRIDVRAVEHAEADEAVRADGQQLAQFEAEIAAATHLYDFRDQRLDLREAQHRVGLLQSLLRKLQLAQAVPHVDAMPL